MGEDLGFLFALLLNGASIGLMYSLIALGFVLVYKATDAINFAQGEFVMLAGMVVVVVLGAEAPLIAAIVAVLLVMIGFGFGLEHQEVVEAALLQQPRDRDAGDAATDDDHANRLATHRASDCPPTGRGSVDARRSSGAQ